MSLLVFKDHKPEEEYVGDNGTTNYLALSLWGLSWYFTLLYLCSISHISEQELVLEKEKTVLPRKRSGVLVHSRIQSTLSYTGIFIILSCRSPEEQIKASKT